MFFSRNLCKIGCCIIQKKAGSMAYLSSEGKFYRGILGCRLDCQPERVVKVGSEEGCEFMTGEADWLTAPARVLVLTGIG